MDHSPPIWEGLPTQDRAIDPSTSILLSQENFQWKVSPKRSSVVQSHTDSFWREAKWKIHSSMSECMHLQTLRDGSAEVGRDF